MIWAAFFTVAKSNLVFLDGKIDPVRYLEILDNTLESLIVEKHE